MQESSTASPDDDWPGGALIDIDEAEHWFRLRIDPDPRRNFGRAIEGAIATFEFDYVPQPLHLFYAGRVMLCDDGAVRLRKLAVISDSYLGSSDLRRGALSAICELTRRALIQHFGDLQRLLLGVRAIIYGNDELAANMGLSRNERIAKASPIIKSYILGWRTMV